MTKCKRCNGQGRVLLGNDEKESMAIAELLTQMGVSNISSKGITICNSCNGTGEKK